jgi:UDP-N-acetylmuramoyl-tripeptide--D-alanyl-D-alanine ligase
MRADVLSGLPTTIEGVAAATGGSCVAPPGALVPRLAGVSIDSRTLEPGNLFVAIVGPRFDGHDFLGEAARRGAAAALVEREVAAPAGLALVRVSDTALALADLARHVRRAAGIPVVGITGSTGKTTTKEMAAAMLASRGPVLKTEGNLNNRYGLPLTLLQLRPEHSAAVLELGMSAAGELRGLADIARPDVAVITNVAPVHLEFFASLDAIAQAKAEILEGLAPGGAAVLNGDDPRLRRMGEARQGRTLWFGRDRAFDVSAEAWRGTAFGMRFELRVAGRSVDVALPMGGLHVVSDFLAAAAAAHVLGVEAEAMAEAALGMRPARHRGEVRRLRGDVTLLDDCYNSNPVAVEAAVATLGMAGGRRRVAVLGDMLELGPTAPEIHRATGERIAGKLDVLVAVGPLAAHLLEGAWAASGPAILLHLPDASAAAASLPGLVETGDAVLVKGSRGVRLEAVVEALVRELGPAQGT